ncbi:MAG TPA: response regulator [Abditibacterium sp.]|jgi:two-component system cell cycle response regulator CpdR
MAHILIAEDTVSIRQIAVLLLESAGHTVVAASDGQIAVAKFEEALDARFLFDLVILDLAMPNMDGFQAAEKIVTLAPEQKVVFLTAFDEPLSFGRAAQILGSGQVWKKPDDILQLCAKVASVL